MVEEVLAFKILDRPLIANLTVKIRLVWEVQEEDEDLVKIFVFEAHRNLKKQQPHSHHQDDDVEIDKWKKRTFKTFA